MTAGKQIKRQDPLRQMLEAAEPKVLIELIEDLAIMLPEVRRECFEYLKEHVELSQEQKETAGGEEIFAIWGELEPDLEELDEYGGDDYILVDHVSDLLHDIREILKEHEVPYDYRRELINEVLSYIQNSNTGLVDELYAVAYAACYDNDDLRKLAKAFEATQDDWPMDHARRIYRDIGDSKKYLELRALRMEYGMDYYELTTFYWDEGKKEKAVETAEKGLAQGAGRLDELRLFLAERAAESGDRKRYLELQFEQTIDQLTLKKYQAFKKLCTKDEWADYEAALVKSLDRTWDSEKLKIRMHRKEYDKALALLMKTGYPHWRYSDDDELKAAVNLEKRFPEQILKYYRSGLGSLNSSSDRKTYARKAKVMKKVRHMYVDILKTPEQWVQFARQVRLDNKRRPAFQEEFGKIVPGWKGL
jgi:hypothetical protein